MQDSLKPFPNRVCPMIVPPYFLPRPLVLFTGLLLPTGRNEIRVANIATVPAGERPVLDDLRIHYHLDVYVKEGNNLKVFKLVVADLTQLFVIRLGVSDLQQI